MVLGISLSLVVSVLWILALYAVYCMAAASLSCLPLSRNTTDRGKNPFSTVEYYGGDAPGTDRICLLESPVEGLGVRLSLFHAARHSLDIVCHTIHPGPSTAAFFEAILEAAERGIKVRILVDGKASNVRLKTVAIVKVLACHPGIEVRRYNPLRMLKPWKWHYLMHDKFIVVDGEYLLLGGRNIGDKFFAPDGFSGKVSNDRDVLVWNQKHGEGSAVGQAMGYFEALWHSPDTACWRLLAHKVTHARVQRAYTELRAQAQGFFESNPAYGRVRMETYLQNALPTRKITLIHNPIAARRKTPWIWQQLERIALDARESVVLQSPYITANNAFLSAFSRIAQQKSFHILTNSAASTPNFPAFSNYYVQRKKFVETGAHIFEYQSRHSIHGKALVCDKRLGIIGSFNMDDRSMHLDTEIMLVIDSEEFAGELIGAIAAYQTQSLRVDGDNAYIVPMGDVPAIIPRYKVPLLRAVSLFSRPLRVFI